jgi:hypothetical protein
MRWPMGHGTSGGGSLGEPLGAEAMAKSQRRKPVPPARVPDARKLPQLRNVNFASMAVLQALREGGWRGLPLPAEDTHVANKSFARILAEHQIDKQIREVVMDYMSERAYAQDPKQFRAELKAFDEKLASFLQCIPSSLSAIALAIKDEWAKGATNDSPCPICDQRLDPELIWYMRFDLERLRGNLEETRELVSRVRDDEPKAGKDANRAGHSLVASLGRVFTEFTGHAPRRSNDSLGVSGPFGIFVMAVNRRIPKDFRLVDVDNFIRRHVESQPG